MALDFAASKRRLFITKTMPLIAFIAGMTIIGFVIQLQWIGTVIIFIYALIALFYHFSASVSVKLALGFLLGSMVATMFALWHIAQNFAAYSFLLFIFCTLQLVVEMKYELQKRRYK